MLDERTPDEVAFDDEVIKALRNGSSIDRALEVAGERYPKEALSCDANNIEELRSHYDYLLNHEDIKSRIEQLSN